MKRPQKFETIFHLIWHFLSKRQIKWKIISFFVAFLEKLNFILLWRLSVPNSLSFYRPKTILDWSNCFWNKPKRFEMGQKSYLVRDIKPLNNHFFSPIFSSLRVEKVNKIVFFQFWTNKKFLFFFNCWNWEKFVEKIEENKIGCLVVWCHRQDISGEMSFLVRSKIIWTNYFSIAVCKKCQMKWIAFMDK